MTPRRRRLSVRYVTVRRVTVRRVTVWCAMVRRMRMRYPMRRHSADARAAKARSDPCGGAAPVCSWTIMAALPPRSIGDRLAELRGPVPPRHHDARTIAALTANPGCARRAVLDAAGVDK